MAEKLDPDAVRHVAHLARLSMSEEEVAAYAEQLSEVLGYIDKLNELDTSEVEPTAHPLPVANVFRADEIRPHWGPAEALANAPDKEATFFRVPKVLDQESA